jgi:hypothetical protein
VIVSEGGIVTVTEIVIMIVMCAVGMQEIVEGTGRGIVHRESPIFHAVAAGEVAEEEEVAVAVGRINNDLLVWAAAAAVAVQLRAMGFVLPRRLLWEHLFARITARAKARVLMHVSLSISSSLSIGSSISITVLDQTFSISEVGRDVVVDLHNREDFQCQEPSSQVGEVQVQVQVQV